MEVRLFVLEKGFTVKTIPNLRPNYPQNLLIHAQWDFAKVRLNSMEDYGRRDGFTAINAFSEEKKIKAVTITIKPPIEDPQAYLNGLVEMLEEYNCGYHINLNGKFPYFEVFQDYPDYRKIVPLSEQ